MIVTAEVPGVDREGLEVEVTPESLSIKAEATSESEDRDATIHRRERVWRRYERTIPLPAEVVSDKAEAHLKEGVLEVRIPKTERTKAETPTRVKVE
ncbi:MAG: Hsp20 family protein [Gemmatimonadales bacterium]|nr:Hsp20 family protein [Gemmatimonadales bacterium]